MAKFRFGDFELDVAAYELRRNTQPVRLERRPMELLRLLVERPRELITRDDIVRRLWGERPAVDVDMGVNTCIRKVRQALQDSADSPVFVETVHAKGYRFNAEVSVIAASGAPETEPLRLAVLPFENLGSDPEQEYFVDGLTEETIIALGQIDPGHVTVLGRTSVMCYKRTTKPLSQIGQELQVEYLIEGSVRSDDDRVRITCRLIRARDHSQLWSTAFNDYRGRVREFQAGLCGAMAKKLSARVSAVRLEALARRHTRDAEAYDLYLRGRYFWNQFTLPTTRRALDYYARATDRDPHYALAWSGQADAIASSPMHADAPPAQSAPRAHLALQRAAAADSRLAEVQTSIGLVNFFLKWDWSAAETAYLCATALDRNYPLAFRMLGVLHTHRQQHSQARASFARARELDVLGMNYALSAMAEMHAGDLEEALRLARQAIALVPDFWIGHYHLAQTYEQLGEHDLALDALNAAGKLSGGQSKVLAVRGYILAKIGKTSDAEAVLSLLEAMARDRYCPPYATALVYAGLGQDESVFKALENALEVRDVNLIFLTVDPKWQRYRAHPRFAELLHRCGFAIA